MEGAYSWKIFSLEESALAQVAINLCQDNDFKEIALRLEKPTYGAFIHEHPSAPFVTNPELLTWKEMKKKCLNDFNRSCDLTDSQKKVKEWEAAIGEQCQRLTEGIPHFIKRRVQVWINRIAMEYLSYSRRQEILFGVSRYLLMDVLTQGDWMKAVRLDEKKLAKRLLRDDRLTVLQRYCIACVYCLPVYISRLWKISTLEEKRSIMNFYSPCISREIKLLVLLWSSQMRRHRSGQLSQRTIYRWNEVANQATQDGNQAAVRSCWNSMEKSVRQSLVIDLALLSVQAMRTNLKMIPWHTDFIERFVSNKFPLTQSFHCIVGFNLPSYHSELMCFFLSQMDEEQQLTFFKRAFEGNFGDFVLESFLNWPHQDEFVPTMSRLWGIMPKNQYLNCLLTLASKYAESFNLEDFPFASLDKKEIHYYDYGSLLWTLWEETPEEYKRFLFLDKNNVEYPEKNPQEQKIAMMCSEEGKSMSSTLILKENWSLVNWLLEECLPKEEIPSFKEKFIRSKCGQGLCLDILEENRVSLVEDLIDWSLEAGKTEYSNELITSKCGLQKCIYLWRQSEFVKVERIIDFCVPLEKRTTFFEIVLSDLLEEFEWELMDTILTWIFDSEEGIRYFKKYLFSWIGITFHYYLVFLVEEWQNVERFYKWFDLSSDKIKELKKDTVFSSDVIFDIRRELLYEPGILESLRWCLTDKDMVMDFKMKVEEKSLSLLNEDVKREKERLNYIVGKLLDGFIEEETCNNKEMEAVLMKGEKRVIATENEPSSSRKRLR
ncbi:uncharacterized protein NPIL_73091 [Nephila pilipes]|uniref:Uncharacterized protein n=1 Tax=Nephila pilipes TaxID=299642 RepID=A0A8X6UJF6_NEPPI|nr:uncharacterized protein NPIL_73091 [Nephila pilipes]